MSATDSPWLHNGHPAVVAHRGYAGLYPENTLLALAAAVSCGARFLEFDIQLTRDGIPVLCHDPNLLRCGNADVNVLDTLWRDLRTIRVGEVARLGPRFARVALPTLAHTVTHLNLWPACTSFVEIKEHSAERFGPAATVAAVMAALAGLQRPYVILSFVDDVVREAQRQGAMLTGWVVRDWDESNRQRLAALAPDYVYCNQDKIAVSEALWQGRWQWVLYEVTRLRDAARWRAAGAAMVESMHPPTFIGPHRPGDARLPNTR